MGTKWVYLFSEVGSAESLKGSWDGARALLGGKGAADPRPRKRGRAGICRHAGRIASARLLAFFHPGSIDSHHAKTTRSVADPAAGSMHAPPRPDRRRGIARR